VFKKCVSLSVSRPLVFQWNKKVKEINTFFFVNQYIKVKGGTRNSEIVQTLNEKSVVCVAGKRNKKEHFNTDFEINPVLERQTTHAEFSVLCVYRAK
jgi:DNA gyrase/topoisomerase IV subunit B